MQLAAHATYILAVSAALLYGRQRQRSEEATAAAAKSSVAAATAETCACEVPTVSYSDPGASAAVADHIARNAPLRVVGVPETAAPLLGDVELREAAGDRIIELRGIGARGHVRKGAALLNATLGEALADGGMLTDAWYAAQISIPMLLAEVSHRVHAPDFEGKWPELAGEALSTSPYLYYYGGRVSDADASSGEGLVEPVDMYLHYDAFENFVQVLDGRKEFWLYDPFQAAQVLYGSNALHGNGSPVDVGSPNATDEYPLFRFALPRRCTVIRGEWLYVPLFWWHRVLSGPSRTLSATHFSRGDPDKKNFFQKTMCGYQLRPAAFECDGGSKARR